MAKEVISRALVLALLVALLAPSAFAHIQGARPVLQRQERDRLIGLEAEPMGIKAELTLSGDPLREFVRHYVDPSRGLYQVEHRTDGSRPQTSAHGEWQFERLIEFRDQNVNGLFEPSVDLALKSWKFTHYQWNRTPIRSAAVADITGNDIVWEGNLTTGPRLRVENVIAGRSFTDEGAVVRPQDVIIYWDFTDMPPRELGSLYALDATITARGDTQFSLYEAENTSTALLADADGRRAFLVWGGTAELDGLEQTLEATITDERIEDDGNKTARFMIHIPTVDESIRFVMVSGIEYTQVDLRAPAPPLGLLMGAAAVAALALRRRAR